MTHVLPGAPERSRESQPFRARVACRVAAALAAQTSGIARAVLVAGTRRPRAVTRARALAIYLAHVGLGVPLATVARSFGRHRASAARACRMVEEQREVAGVDRHVEALERLARQRLEGAFHAA